jgi:hypothetical protein
VDSETRSGCRPWCRAVDRCREVETVNAAATAEKPKSSKSEWRMRQGANGEKVGYREPRSKFDLLAPYGYIKGGVSAAL